MGFLGFGVVVDLK